MVKMLMTSRDIRKHATKWLDKRETALLRPELKRRVLAYRRNARRMSAQILGDDNEDNI